MNKEETIKDIQNIINANCWTISEQFASNVANAIYNAGYRKVPDGAVILTPEERDDELKACNEKQAELENEIKRLKADNKALEMWNDAYTEENEKLKIYNDKLCQGIYWGNGEHFSISIEKAKQNAVKEFSEKLKTKAFDKDMFNDWAGATYVVLVREIDKLLKEFTE